MFFFFNKNSSFKRFIFIVDEKFSYDKQVAFLFVEWEL